MAAGAPAPRSYDFVTPLRADARQGRVYYEACFLDGVIGRCSLAVGDCCLVRSANESEPLVALCAPLGGSFVVSCVASCVRVAGSRPRS